MFDPVGITSPNAGQKICLQLEPDRELVVFSFTDAPSHRLHTITDTEQILHMMSHFMRDDVGLCEISSGTQALLEFIEKPEIDVNAPIFRTIERTSRATGETTAGLSLVCEEDKFRFFVLATHLPEDCMPRVFGIGENDGDELRCLVVRRLIVVLRILR